MGQWIGAGLGMLGIVLLGSGLLWPRDLFTLLWQSVLGLVLTIVGFALVLSASRSGGRGLAALLGLLGLALLAVAIVPTVIGLSLYGGFGSLLRGVLGLLFCVAAYAIVEWGPDLFGYDDDPF